jgi:hypothetical protein
MPTLQITVNKPVEQVQLLEDLVGQPMRLKGVAVSWGAPPPLGVSPTPDPSDPDPTEPVPGDPTPDPAQPPFVVTATNNNMVFFPTNYPRYSIGPSYPVPGYYNPMLVVLTLEQGEYTADELAEAFNDAAINNSAVMPGYGAYASTTVALDPYPLNLNVRCRWDPDVERFEFYQIPSPPTVIAGYLSQPSFEVIEPEDAVVRNPTMCATYMLLSNYAQQIPVRAFPDVLAIPSTANLAYDLFGLTVTTTTTPYLVVPPNGELVPSPPTNLLRASFAPVTSAGVFDGSKVMPAEEIQLGALVDLSQLGASTREFNAYSPHIGPHSYLFLPRPPYIAPNEHTNISQNPTFYYLPLNLSFNTNDIKRTFIIETKLDSKEGGQCIFGENCLHSYTLYFDYAINENHF